MIAFGITDKGIVRPQNEDSFRLLLAPDGRSGVAVLCDGMGGEQSGEIASALAADAFVSYAEEGLRLSPDSDCAQIARESVSYANLQVYDRAMRDRSCRGMGTTLVGVVWREEDIAVVNVGDSRCYWFADGYIQQVTRDHSFVQELIDNGTITPGEARSHPHRNLITRALGLERQMRSDIFRLDTAEGDKLLLCSDGLSNVVGEEELLSLTNAASSLENAAEVLLALALERGAPDNVTVLLLKR